MSNTPEQPTPIVYFDSCVFIAFMKGKDEIDRAEVVLQILEDAMNGKIELYTSQAGIAECPLSDSPIRYDSTGRDVVEVFFEQRFIRKVQVDKYVAYRSREIQRASKQLNPQKPVLKTMDAIHVATALIYKADRIFTYDKKHLLKYDRHALVEHIPICEPCRFWDTQPKLSEISGFDTRSFQDKSIGVGLGVGDGVAR